MTNPIIVAIDEGHVAEFDVEWNPKSCKKCEDPWPCAKILAARERNRVFADSLPR